MPFVCPRHVYYSSCIVATFFLVFFVIRNDGDPWPTVSLPTDVFFNRSKELDVSLANSHHLFSSIANFTSTSETILQPEHVFVNETSYPVNVAESHPSELQNPSEHNACDLYTGSWVVDDDYPLYHPKSCPYVDEAYSCQGNGRPDSSYMKWRWKPEGCNLPRFNATDFLERLRGKRLMMVGDSMNRNEFESMLCLLRESLSDKSRMYETRGHKIRKGRGYYIFSFLDYNCTVEFIRSHFLVKEGTRLYRQGKKRPILLIDQVDKSAKRWKKADILIFNTGHWWNHGKTSRGIDYFQEGGYFYPHLEVMEAFRKAMQTWGMWVKEFMNSPKKLVFYRGYSTSHFRGGDWDSGGTCHRETMPILNGTFLDNYPLTMKIVEEVMEKMKVPAILLNVTRLTNSRKDGHPSVYGKASVHRRSLRKQDCSHWCLPGVPDAWNELMYVNVIMNRRFH